MPQRVCPPGKIVNPATDRCVLVNGKIGKQILRRQAMEAGISASRGPACPSGKIYNVQTDRCVNVRGAPGRRIVKQIERFLDARNPVLQLLPPELALEIWGLAYERPKNCGRLVADLRTMEIDGPAAKTVLQRSVVKTLQQLKRILEFGHYTKYARMNHENEATTMVNWTSAILWKAKRRNVTVDQLIGYCRRVVAVKQQTSALVDQLQSSLHLAEEYVRTGDLSPKFTGNVILSPYDLPRIRRLRRSSPTDALTIRRVIQSFKRNLAKDQTVVAMLRKPIDIRK